VEDAEDEEARLAAERERGGGLAFIARPRKDDRCARAWAARARGRRHTAPLLRPRDGSRAGRQRARSGVV